MRRLFRIDGQVIPQAPIRAFIVVKEAAVMKHSLRIFSVAYATILFAIVIHSSAYASAPSQPVVVPEPSTWTALAVGAATIALLVFVSRISGTNGKHFGR